VALDTVSTRSNRAFALYFQALFSPLGFTVRLFPVRQQGRVFYNMLAHRGPRRSPPLLLNTHTDTVPPGSAALWTRTGGDPFRLTRRGNFLHGLGAADVKLNLICQWEALRRLRDERFLRPLCVAGTFGEERGLRGARRLVEAWRGPRPAWALVGEPSRGRVVDRHRGYMVFEWRLRRPAFDPPRGGGWWRLTARGRSAHSATPQRGVNALEKLWMFLSRPELGKTRVLWAEGGTAPNQVPAEAEAVFWCSGLPRVPPGDLTREPAPSGVQWEVLTSVFRRGMAAVAGAVPRGGSFNPGRFFVTPADAVLVFDLRYPPEVDPDRLYDRVIAAAGGVARAAGILSRLRMEHEDPPLEAPRRHPGLDIFRRALADAGVPFRRGEKPTCTEAGVYQGWGVPAWVWGPGVSTGNVHRPNEKVALGELSRAADVHEALIRRWCLTSPAL
jgi:succinyl-diaminopimelate desuccinylase